MNKNKLKVISRISKPLKNLPLRLAKNLKIVQKIKKNQNQHPVQQQEFVNFFFNYFFFKKILFRMNFRKKKKIKDFKEKLVFIKSLVLQC